MRKRLGPLAGAVEDLPFAQSHSVPFGPISPHFSQVSPLKNPANVSSGTISAYFIIIYTLDGGALDFIRRRLDGAHRLRLAPLFLRPPLRSFFL